MSEPSSEGEEVEPRLKLECVASWKLFGWVQVKVLVLKMKILTFPIPEYG